MRYYSSLGYSLLFKLKPVSLVFLIVLGLCAAGDAHALSTGGLSFSITPIVGYERVQEIVPKPHTKDRLTYGARATAGLPIISLEVEYTQGQSSEDFRPSPDLMTKDSAQNLKVGARTKIPLTSMIHAIGRAGVQATKDHHEETVGGVTTAVDQPIVYKPYAGVGFSVGLTPKIAATGEIVAVFNKWPDMSQNNYQTTVGVVISVP